MCSDSSSPKVSIIATVYNVEDYIDAFLHCMVNQTLKDIEIIIVDDKTPDRSIDIVEKYMSEHANIVLVRNDHNMGLALSRNEGIKVAKGEYVLFIDSDDLIPFDAAETLYKTAQKYDPDVTVSYMGFFLPGETKVRVVDYLGRNRLNLKDYPIQYNDPKKDVHFEVVSNTTCGKLYKRSFLNDNDLWFRYYRYTEDMPFSHKYNLHAGKIAFTDRVLYYYRQNRAGSLMDNKPAAKPTIMDIIDEIYENVRKKNCSSKVELDFWRFAFHRIYTVINESRDEFKEELTKDAIKFFDTYYVPFVNKNDISDDYCEYIREKIYKNVHADSFGKVLCDFRVQKGSNIFFTKFLYKKGRLTDYLFDERKLSVFNELFIIYSILKAKNRRFSIEECI